MKRILTGHLYLLALIIFYLTLSLLTYKHFGITYDEPLEYNAGKYYLEYLANPFDLKHLKDLAQNSPSQVPPHHTPPLSIYSRIYPSLLNILNPNFYYEWFHLQNMFVGALLFMFSYSLFHFHYKNQKKAILAPLFLLLTPPVFGHIPANPKDIPFATVYLLGISMIYIFKESKVKPSIKIISLGLVFGFALALRSVGITLFFGYVFYEVLTAKDQNLKFYKNLFAELVLMFAFSFVIWVFLLPYLRTNTFQNLITLFSNSTDFVSWNNEMLYFGEYLTKYQRPWQYLFVYLLIKLPVSTLVLLFFGAILLAKRKLSLKKTHPINLLSFLVLINMGLYLILNPVVYNGLRHFLYVLIPLVLIACFLLIEIIKKYPQTTNTVLYLVIVYFLFTVIRMIHLHPYQYVYFNELTFGLKGVNEKLDTDYWGASYIEGTKMLKAIILAENYINKDLELINVYACDNQQAVQYYSNFQFNLVNKSNEAHYILCSTHTDNKRLYDQTHELIYSVQREKEDLLRIRRKKF